MAWTLLILYCFAIFAAALLGGWLPRRLAMTHTRTQLVMSLVSGLMLGVACYHLVPHSVAAASDIDFTMQWLMAGMVFMLLIIFISMTSVLTHKPVATAMAMTITTARPMITRILQKGAQR
jgi:hypothetical protein